MRLEKSLRKAINGRFTRRRRSFLNGNGSVLTSMAGALAGSALMYFLDPRTGSRRRAVVRDKAVRALHVAEEATGKTARDLAHRSRGLIAGVAGRIDRELVDDDTLAERVRAELGRVTSHPHAIKVTCQNGVVQLNGPILKREKKRLLRAMKRVPGVLELHDLLEAYRQADNMPDLQGGVRREPRFELRQENWSPAPRLLTGTAGLALTALGLRGLSRISAPLALGAGLAGLALFTRSATNRPLKRVFGAGAGRQAVELEKELTVHAPVGEVYAFWRAMENFPRFMTHVKEVRQLQGGQYHWIVTGPASLSFAWDAEITAEDPDRLLAWRSIDGTLVPNAGVVRFDPVDGGTRIHVRMSYHPPGGAMGHAFAQLLGADPGKQMDDDLGRFKSLMEEGRVTREEIMSDGLGR